MIEAALALAAASLTLTCYDVRHRRLLEAKLTKAEADLRDTLAKLAETHNSLARLVQEVQDQVNNHELRLGGLTKGSTQSWARPSQSPP